MSSGVSRSLASHRTIFRPSIGNFALVFNPGFSIPSFVESLNQTASMVDYIVLLPRIVSKGKDPDPRASIIDTDESTFLDERLMLPKCSDNKVTKMFRCYVL